MIMGSGGREMRGMHPPGERRLMAGDLVTTELTPCVDGYYAQICRTLVLGEPSAAQLSAFDVYIEAVEAGYAVLRAGVTASAVARAENDVFRRHGLEKYTTSEYTRVRGHGCGLFVDNKPHILEDVDTVLGPGATLIVHPNIYHPEVGYMVLGDTVVVTRTATKISASCRSNCCRCRHGTRAARLVAGRGPARRSGCQDCAVPDAARESGHGRTCPLHQLPAAGGGLLPHAFRAPLEPGRSGGPPGRRADAVRQPLEAGRRMDRGDRAHRGGDLHAAAGRDDRRFSERAARGAQIYRCPGAIAAPRRDRRAVGRWHPTGRLADASALFAAARHTADEAELALSAHAERMAQDTFAGIGAVTSSAPLVSALDGQLRHRGAEEVLISIAPDLDRDIRLVRPEADSAFGVRAATGRRSSYRLPTRRIGSG